MGVIQLVSSLLRALLANRAALAMENLVLRQQLAVLGRSVKRPALRQREPIAAVNWRKGDAAQQQKLKNPQVSTPMEFLVETGVRCSADRSGQVLCRVREPRLMAAGTADLNAPQRQRLSCPWRR